MRLTTLRARMCASALYSLPICWMASKYQNRLRIFPVWPVKIWNVVIAANHRVVSMFKQVMGRKWFGVWYAMHLNVASSSSFVTEHIEYRIKFTPEREKAIWQICHRILIVFHYFCIAFLQKNVAHFLLRKSDATIKIVGCLSQIYLQKDRNKTQKIEQKQILLFKNKRV